MGELPKLAVDDELGERGVYGLNPRTKHLSEHYGPVLERPVQAALHKRQAGNGLLLDNAISGTKGRTIILFPNGMASHSDWRFHPLTMTLGVAIAQ
jgi:hypothetical protein